MLLPAGRVGVPYAAADLSIDEVVRRTVGHAVAIPVESIAAAIAHKAILSCALGAPRGVVAIGAAHAWARNDDSPLLPRYSIHQATCAAVTHCRTVWCTGEAHSRKEEHQPGQRQGSAAVREKSGHA